ncbi:hypothetical protein B0T10DRAFT_600701 [Thelonectria olida]|uniref:Uncharacterized protein n=1 Tax=Thelonectria olida TaxID=1576542 RepID=A0A9P8WGR3_9HYPO|nr:hypothetical protein B0T10DRAFT_600701 [Thelonectria olida]
MSDIISIQRPSPSAVKELKPRQLRRFYEPVILRKAIADIAHKHGTIKPPDRPPRPKTAEERFHRYVDKLANMCDWEKGGNTVTAFAILDTEDAFVYVFGCNEVSDAGLRQTAEFVVILLQKISGFRNLKPAEKDAVKKDIFNLLVLFNRPRVEKYLSALRKELMNCIKSCGDKTHNGPPMLEKWLQELHDAIEDITLEGVERSDYLDSCSRCFRQINTFRKATPTKHIDDVADEVRLHDNKSMACWSEMRHYLARLIAYERAVTTFVDTEAEWPELFQEFKIWPVSSGPRGKKPLGTKSEGASSIIGRMSSDDTKTEHYRKLAEGLQMEPYSLDTRIQNKCRSSSFKPRVHGEVLVLDWIIRKFDRPKLFNGYQYIGTSKGTCKLCEYYFQADPSQIKARPSHGNVYTNWAFPEVHERDGKGAIPRRQKIFDSMLGNIRIDAFLILEERSATGKRHDSNTYELVSRLQGTTDAGTGGSDTSEVEELSEQFEANLSFTNTSTAETCSLDSDDDDEGGGAALS